ncbi:MAG: RAMP superfamily CRISPR-associated protein [Nitrococcus sp.]|nr:RAMP superfamily CRISPR-associated protein [Nitrococcus sp.]
MTQRPFIELSEHNNPGEGRKATAPYNFVPLPETVVPAVDSPDKLPDHDSYYVRDNDKDDDKYKHSGYFDVTLTTKSPLYIRCPLTLEQFASNEEEKDQSGQPIGRNTPFTDRIKNPPEFFYTRAPEQPVIPGSSLRGMLRALLEIVSYGKTTSVTDKRLFYRTVDGSSVGKHYSEHMMWPKRRKQHPDPKKNDQIDVFAVRVRGGFFRERPDGSYVIEECDVGRVDLDDSAMLSPLGVSKQSDLYDGAPGKPSATPNWAYQHREVWAAIDPEDDIFFREQWGTGPGDRA